MVGQGDLVTGSGAWPGPVVCQVVLPASPPAFFVLPQSQPASGPAAGLAVRAADPILSMGFWHHLLPQ